MSSVILEHVDGATYGKRMPSVFIDRIEVDYDDGVGDVNEDAIVTAYLTIKFTKNPVIQAKPFETVIENLFDNLGLNICLTYHDWVKPHFQENKFSLRTWFLDARYYATTEYRSNCYKHIPLNEILTTTHDAVITNSSRFDQNGNEIVEITGIKIEIPYLGSSSSEIPNISQVPNLMLFAFVGLSAEDLYHHRSADMAGQSSHTKTFNKNFGDISWYHVLEKGNTAPKFYEVYTSENNIPYYGQVLQSVNGKLFSTDEYSLENLTGDFSEMISGYDTDRVIDHLLDNNIKSLEAIIYASGNHIGILNELETYRATFPNKASNTQSGQFYNNFVIKFSEVIQKVESQTELSSKILYDSLVVDKRLKLINPPYIQPYIETGGSYDNISSWHTYRGIPGEMDSEMYIPRGLFSLSRKAFLASDPAGRLDEDSIKKMYGRFWHEGTGIPSMPHTWAEMMLGTGEDLAGPVGDWAPMTAAGESSALMAKLEAYYIAQGYLLADAAAMAIEEYQYQMASAGSSADLLNPALDGADYLEFRAGNFKVMNKGFFFFDYEKAVRTQSKISQVFNIRKLQHFFRINIPYEHFYVKNVDLGRNEACIPWLTLPLENNYTKSTMRLEMVQPTGHAEGFMGSTPITDPSYVDFPKPSSTKIIWEGGSIIHEEGLHNYLANRLRYLSPMVEVGNGTDLEFVYSYLTFFNFDVATNDSTKRLEGHNSMEGMGATGYASVEGQRVMDGYRLMGFKFQDIMDDDVAWYNTSAPDPDEAGDCDGATRSERILETPDIASPMATTKYQITVRTEDVTQVTYDKFVQYITGIYNDFTIYASEAAEICSHNNLNNTYNQFFVDSINEVYPEKPWYKAAYAAIALSELLFNDGATSQENFDSRVLEIILKIGPETGNLLQTQEFGKEFNALMQYLRGDIEDISEGRAPAPDADTPWKTMMALGPTTGRTYEYYNEVRFDKEPISGDFQPDHLGPDHFNLRDAAPLLMARPMGSVHDYGYDGMETPAFSAIATSAVGLLFDEEWKASADLDDPNFIKYVYETIFVPYSYEHKRSRALRLPSATVTADGLTGTWSDGYFEGNVTRLLGGWYETGTDDSTLTTADDKSGAMLFADRIFKRSTVDNKIRNPADTGYEGKRRAASSARSSRRVYRDLAQLRYLLTNYLLPEANRRVSAGDNNLYNNLIELANNPGSEGGHESPAFTPGDSPARARYMQHLNPRIKIIIEEMIAGIDHLFGIAEHPVDRLSTAIVTYPDGDSLDGATAGYEWLNSYNYRDRNDPYGLTHIVDLDDPFGPESFVGETSS